MTDTATRKGSTNNPVTVIEVTSAADLGPLVLAPDGVMRVQIPAGTEWRIKNSITLPRLWLDKPPGGAPTLTHFIGTHVPAILVNGDDTPHIWGVGISLVEFELLQFVDVSNGGSGLGTRLFDITGSGDFTFVFTGRTIFTLFKYMGELTDIGLVSDGPSAYVYPGGGYTIRSSIGVSPNVSMSQSRAEGLAALPDMRSALFSFIGEVPSVLITQFSLRLAKVPNAFLFIDVGSTGAYNVANNHYLGGPTAGNFFREPVSLSIVSQADASIAVASFSDSAVNPGVDTSVVFGGPVDFKPGETVLISGEAAYDGIRIIVRVADDQQSFDIAVVHSTSGAGSIDMVTHTMSSANRFVRGETVVITGTTDYNGSVQTLRIGDSSFTTPQAFVSSPQAGAADSVSKDQTDLNVIAQDNTAQESSTVLGEACWNGNVSSTTITDGTYVPLVLTGAMLAAGAERVGLADAASGRLRYDGEAPVRLSIAISLFGEKGGASPDNYRIAITKNGAVLAFVSTPYSPLELRDTNKQVIYTPTIQLDPADEVQAMIAGDGSTAAVTFTDGQFIVRV